MSIPESEIAKFLVTVIKKTVRKNKDELEFLLKGSNRWEKWFQVEFASELIQNDARDVKLEYMSPLDGRKKITNFRICRCRAKTRELKQRYPGSF